MAGCGGSSLPLTGANRADDDAKLVGATAASQRQLDKWHVAVPTGRQGLEVKSDGMLAGATPGRYVIALREGSRRRQSIRPPGPLPHFARSSHARIAAAASGSSGSDARSSARRSFGCLRPVTIAGLRTRRQQLAVIVRGRRTILGVPGALLRRSCSTSAQPPAPRSPSPSASAAFASVGEHR